VPKVGRFEKNGSIILPTNTDQFFDMVKWVLKNPGDYKTVVFDSGKFIDRLIFADVIRRNPTTTIHKEIVQVESIADYTFGTGYAKAMRYWDRFLSAVDALHAKGLNAILICHTKEKSATNRDGEEFKKTQMDLFGFGEYNAAGLIYARADWVYLIESKVSTMSKKNAFGAVKTTAMPDHLQPPEIIVYTRSGNSFDAKVRTSDIKNIPNQYVIDIEDDETSKIIFSDLEK